MNFKINKILIIGTNNEFTNKLITTFDNNIELYGFDIVTSVLNTKKYTKVFNLRKNNLTTIINELIKIKFDIIYLFDYFTYDLFFLDFKNTEILFYKLKYLINKIIKPKRFIFISNTKPLKLIIENKFKNLDFENLKLKYSFILENLIKRSQPQNWRIIRYNNLYSYYYFNNYIHSLLYNGLYIKANPKEKSSIFYIPNEFVTSFIHLEDAINILKIIEKIKDTGVFIIGNNNEKINIRDYYQYLFCKLKIKPKYFIKKNYEDWFYIENSNNFKKLNYNFEKKFYDEIDKIIYSKFQAMKKFRYKIENIYNNINLS